MRDAELRELHSQNMHWHEIATAMHLSVFSVKERAARLGLHNYHLMRKGPNPESTSKTPKPKPAEPKPDRLKPGESTLPPLQSLEMPLPVMHEDEDDV